MNPKTKLKRSVFLKSLPKLTESRFCYSCHLLLRDIVFGSSESEFYNAAFQGPLGFLQAQFGPNSHELTDEELLTCRVVALQLAALLVAEGFTVEDFQ